MVLQKLILSKVLTQDFPPYCKAVSGRATAVYTRHLSTRKQYSQSVRGGKVYIVFLDVRRALDTVWHKSLMFKAYGSNVLYGRSYTDAIHLPPV